MKATVLLASLLLCAPASAQSQSAAPAPTAAPKSPAKPKPPIYDEKADGAAVINAALAKAAKNNRRVLVQWGANWCGWCHLLHEAMASDKDLKREVLYEYDVVLLDVGRFDENLDLAAKYGADIKSGVPYITILDSTGKPVVNQETGSLESKEKDKHEHDRAAVLKFLKANEATPRIADDVLKDGLSRARPADKVVFLHFGAPWCGWCHKLEDWMARADVAPTLAKAFIDIKIDVERDKGGKDAFARFNSASEKSGIPWFVFLDGDGKVLATSTGPKGNVGFPAASDEVEHFGAMLKAAGVSEAEVTTLSVSLRATNGNGQ